MWDRFDAEFREAERKLRKTGLVDLDVARFTQKAGEACLKAEEGLRARQAFTMSADQWTAMGRFDAAAEVEQHLL